MEIKPKFGIIIFLDALGARTTDIDVSEHYLSTLDKLGEELKRTKYATAQNPAFTDQVDQQIAKELQYRFFGDSVLIADELTNEDTIKARINRVLFIVCNYIHTALKEGILYRGALAIGQYLERDNVLLGPAVTDAANWYGRSDWIGAILTPSATNYMKAIFGIKSDSRVEDIISPMTGLLLYDVPLSGPDKGSKIRTYALDWPTLSEFDIKLQKSSKDELACFYDKIKLLQVPRGAETKYSNTEDFIREHIRLREKSGRKLS